MAVNVVAPLLTTCLCLTGQAAQPPGQVPRREHDATGSSTEGREHAIGGTGGGGASRKQGGRAPSMPRRVPHGHGTLMHTCTAFAWRIHRFVGKLAPGQVSMNLHVSLCMRRSGRFDLPGELAPIVQPALVVPVPRDIPTEGGTSRCALEPFHQHLECTSSGIRLDAAAS